MDKLEIEFKKVSKHSSKLRNEIEELKLKMELPKLKKQYEGKFWKYKNSCRIDENWWLYSFCKECINDRQGLFDTFQTSVYQSEFKNNKEEYYHLCQEEISKEEYLSAYNDFKSNLELLNIL